METKSIHPVTYAGISWAANLDRLKIMKLCAKTCDTTIERMKSRRRDSHMVDARMYFAVICRRYKHMSFQKIGDLINRDHATVMHLIKRFEDTYLTPYYERVLGQILNNFSGTVNEGITFAAVCETITSLNGEIVKTGELTPNKIYTVHKKSNRQILITNDKNKLKWYKEIRFRAIQS